jgi:hypothetical protein
MHYHGDLDLLVPRQLRGRLAILHPATHEVEFPSSAAPIHHVGFEAQAPRVEEPGFLSAPPLVHEPSFSGQPSGTQDVAIELDVPSLTAQDTAAPSPSVSGNLLPGTGISDDLAPPLPAPETRDLAEQGMDDWREMLGLKVPPEFLDAGNVRIWEQNLDEDSIVHRLERMDPSAFEYVVAELLRRTGYADVWVTGGVRGETIHLIATRTPERERVHTAVCCVQAETVTVDDLEPFLEAMASDARFTTGLLVTCGSLDDACREEIDGDDSLDALDGPELARRIQDARVVLPDA